MDEDEDDYVFFGTPIEREEETSARKRKAVADAGQLRALPVWKQEVTDEQGRRRFHGAFTGGYSAGYYNTVGSKEGWTPQTFTSSRKNRSEVKKQSVYNFLDEDDIKDMGGNALETSSQFDTFGITVSEVARKQAEKEQQKRPSAIPGPVPDEIVLPATDSIGVKLLVKMGWRRGHSIKETLADSLYDARREARKALLAFSGNEKSSEPSEVESSKPDLKDITDRSDDGILASRSTPVYVLYPKQDLHGLGYDPFKHAPEFRDRKRLHDSKYRGQGTKTNISARSKLLSSNSGKYAPGFGIGALEELDVEDEDIYASGFDFVATEVEEDEPASVAVDNKLKLEYKKQGVLSGFKVSLSSDYNLERFHPPVVPPDFEPLHKFVTPPETLDKFSESPPLEVPPPEDNSLKLLIEGFATLVARCGKLFEDLSKEKNKSNPLFSFLSGGNGHNYYARKLWEAKQKNIDRHRVVDMKSISSERKMTAESRGRILGEKPLDRTSSNSTTAVAHKEVIVLQSNLSDNFTKPTSVVDFPERAKPFKDDPAKQKRFEQFLKDKYHGGLRSSYSGGRMSDNDRAREKLDFEAAAEAIEKGDWKEKPNLQSTPQVMDFLGGGSRFVSSTTVEKQHSSQVEETMSSKGYPKREEFQWRPAPILCKRFDLIDPFMGKPPPLPRPRSKLDSLIFMPDSFMNIDAPKRDLPTSQSEPRETENRHNKENNEIEPDITNVERPVDLYKAIFSDDSDDDEVDNAGFSNAEDPEKIEGVNTTLNRLVAGDFLESLGKELGLEVPPEKPNSVNMINSTLIETRRNLKAESIVDISNKHLKAETKSSSVNIMEKKSASNDKSVRDGDLPNILNSKAVELSREGEVEVKKEKEHRSRKHRSHSRHHRRRYSSSSDSDSSYDRSKSRSEKRTSSKGKSRKRSDHHSHKRSISRSPSGYPSHGKGRDVSSDDRKDRRSRDQEKHARRMH